MTQKNNELTEGQRVADQIAYYDSLIAGYVEVIQKLSDPDAPEEAKLLIAMATESIDHCESKRAVLTDHQKNLGI